MPPSKNEIKEAVSEFKKSIQYPDIKISPEINEILNQNRLQLKSKSREELCIDTILLGQYALYLHNESNRFRAVIKWCDANINSILGRELPNTHGYGFIEKSLIIKRNDIQAMELEDIKTFSEIKLQYIADIDRKIEFIATSIKNLIYSK